MKEKTILFVSLSTKRIYDIPEDRPLLEPLWAEYLAAMIPEHNVHILDMNIDADVKTALEELNPDFIGISITTPLVKEAKVVIQTIRQVLPLAKIIIGGPHVCALEGKDLDHDIAILGEAEASIKEIIEGYSKRTLKGSPLNGLDSLPFPARISREPHRLKYNFGVKKQILASVITSRSCPYQCIFCASKSIFGNKLRFRSPENIIEELTDLKERYKVNSVIFLDDCFSLDKERVKKICTLMIERNLNIKWWVDTRCDHVDQPLLELMKAAGCMFIVYGVEAGSPEVLKRIRKNITIEQIREAFRVTKEAGIDTKCNIMLGHLDETEDQIWQSIALAKELAATKTSFYKVIALPGSELYDIATKRGLINSNSNFEDFAWYLNTPNISKVSSERLEELQKIAYNNN